MLGQQWIVISKDIKYSRQTGSIKLKRKHNLEEKNNDFLGPLAMAQIFLIK